MAVPPTKITMFNFFEKLPSKTSIAIEEDPRKVAPIFNKQHVDEFQHRLEQFDSELVAAQANLTEQNSNQTYLSSIKLNHHKPFRIDKKRRGPLRAKLLQFNEDVRPPYFGTWQKESKSIKGRKPFALDNEIFDYDIDSEAEWDIGGPGESLKGDDSDDDEEQDEYEIDMKTFVPHGYVSDDEIEAGSDSEDHPPMSPNDNEENANEIGSGSDSEVKILEEIKPTQVQQPKQTPKRDMKAIVLGLSFENNPSLSETKQEFLKSFQGFLCSTK